jgi:hypothetical protein
VNATLSAYQSELERMYSDLVELLQLCDTNAVNWRPPVDETNSIAEMVSHLVGATGRWLSHAAGNRIAGDREAEFRAHANPDDLVALVEQARSDARAWFADLENIDPAAIRSATPEYGPDLSVAWCIQHALGHAFEHWGQIQLTRQLAANR